MTISPGQLNYWRHRTNRPKLTLGQAAYQRAQAMAKPVKPAPLVQKLTPAQRTWETKNASGLTGQQQLYQAWLARNPGATLPTPAGGVPAPQQPEGGAIQSGDYQDSEYFSKIGQLAQQRMAKLQDLRTQGEQDQTNTQETLRRFREQQPRQEESAVNAANKAGLLYSGALGENLGNIRTNAIRQEADIQGAYSQRDAARLAAKTALENGATVDEAAAAAEAVDRATTRDADAADSRSLVKESQIPTDDLDAGVDVGTPRTTGAPRTSTNRTPSYLPKGYSRWSRQQRSRYWARRRKARR